MGNINGLYVVAVESVAPCVALEGAVQDFIHRKNLEHYRRLLAGPDMDQAMREYVSKLLEDEEAKELPQSNGRKDD